MSVHQSNGGCLVLGRRFSSHRRKRGSGDDDALSGSGSEDDASQLVYETTRYRAAVLLDLENDSLRCDADLRVGFHVDPSMAGALPP